MASRAESPPGAASVRGASQPATDASPTGGTSQPSSGAPLVEHEQERPLALNGEWYTREEFRQFHQQSYGRYWDQAVREAVPPDLVSTRDPSQLAIAASPRGGASLPQRRNQADEAHQQEETRAEEKSDEQEDNETDGNPIIEEFLQAILLDHEQAVSPVGSEIAAGESMAVLMQGLRSRNEKMLRTALACQAQLLEFGERISQRPRGAAGRDETWRVPRSWG